MTDSTKSKLSNSQTHRELSKAQEQFDAFDKNVKEMTMDRMNMASKQDSDVQTKMSQSEIDRSKEIYLKPKKAIGSREKFNEDYREQYNFQKEYVKFIAENKEIIGESIQMWTKPFAGMPAEEWEVPVNKPLWAPRYVAEQIKKCFYHRLTMQQSNITSADGYGSYYGTLVSDTTVQRLDATPVSPRKSVFVGASA